MSSDIKAVPRFEYTPYGMVEVIDGWYVNISDHEAAISELRSNHERVVGELVDQISIEMAAASMAADTCEYQLTELETLRDTLAESRAEVHRQAKVIEAYRLQKIEADKTIAYHDRRRNNHAS